MKKLFHLILVIIILLFGLISLPPVFAASTSQIKSFHSDMVAHKDGSLDVTETIIYDFGNTPKHGIYRQIPFSSEVGSDIRKIIINFTTVTMDGKDEPYTEDDTSTEDGIKIGDANTTITGAHTYVISYQVENQVGNYSDHDEIYWNVNGTEWTVPIATESAQIKADFPTTITKTTCYTGKEGSTAQDCISKIASPSAIFSVTKPLDPSENMSIVAGFPPNTFPKSQLQQPDKPVDIDPGVVMGIVIVILLAVIFYYVIVPLLVLLWYLKHRHINRFGKPTVTFDFPTDANGLKLAPAEAGTIDDGDFKENDVTATIFDLAIRKYVTLLNQQSEPNKLIIQRNKPVDQNLNAYEITLLTKLFQSGDSIDIDTLENDFYTTFDNMKNQVSTSLNQRGLTNREGNSSTIYIVLAVLGLFSGNLILAGLCIYFFNKQTNRTDAGDKAKWQIDGLKIFLANMSREYKWQADNLITAEKYIPYAIALGYINEFMSQLKAIYPDYQPTWYVGTGIYVSYLLFYSRMNQTFSPPAPVASSSSSGFSSVGFSGGGGGGGGGGDW